MHLPPPHQAFLDRALPVLQADPRVYAVIVAGSAVTGGMDVWSDLDLVAVVEDDAEAALHAEHFVVVGRLGPLLSAFRGEHVGEPRLIIAVFDLPMLHVDVKFVARRDTPRLLAPVEVAWARGEVALPEPAPPRPFDVQWCADRLPGWVHYLALKLGRGELFEAINSLEFLRWRVLAPLIALEAGVAPRSLRRLEETGSPRLAALARTVCAYDRDAIREAGRAAFTLAFSLLDGHPEVRRSAEAEAKTMAFLESRRSDG